MGLHPDRIYICSISKESLTILINDFALYCDEEAWAYRPVFFPPSAFAYRLSLLLATNRASVFFFYAMYAFTQYRDSSVNIETG